MTGNPAFLFADMMASIGFPRDAALACAAWTAFAAIPEARMRGPLGLSAPNLYVLLVGPPGAGKSSLIRCAVRAVRTARLGSSRIIAPPSFSLEGFVDALGFSSLAMVLDEFRRLERVAERDSEASLSVLNELYDPTETELQLLYVGQGQARRTIPPNRCVALLSGTTPELPADFALRHIHDSGLLSRTATVWMDRTQHLSGDISDTTAEACGMLAGAIRHARSVLGERPVLTLDRSVWAAIIPLREHETRRSTSRTATIALKCAAALALLDGSPCVSHEHARAAAAWARGRVEDNSRLSAVAIPQRAMEQRVISILGQAGKPIPLPILAEEVDADVQNVMRVTETLARAGLVRMHRSSQCVHVSAADGPNGHA